MSLNSNLYQALEDVVGPKNISQDLIEAYSYIPLNPHIETASGIPSPRYEAVILPDSTEQVQAIVRLCNKYKTQYKASSTGFGMYNDPLKPGVLKIDLRRMNRIVEINEKGMYAVVEPYVLGAQLQAELMKRGLNCNLTGAGSNCSAHPLVAHQNFGHLSVSGSYGERNLLAFEWVTPDGEIVRSGSLGSIGEWFCGDGPGPSLRGIVRGTTNAMGGLGVHTKAAQKLYHWPGPPVFPVEGISPHYAPNHIPPGFMIRYFYFPSMKLLDEAILKIGESELAFILMGFNISMIVANMATSNDEDVTYLKKYMEITKGRPGFMIIIAANSQRDFEYKTEALNLIVKESQGESLDLVEDPKNAGGFMWRWIRPTASIREVFRATGLFGGMLAGTDSHPLMSEYIQRGSPVKADLIKKDWIFADSTEPFVQAIEHGHCGHGEMLIRWTPRYVPEAVNAQKTLTTAQDKIAIEGKFGVGGSVWGDGEHDLYGPYACNYHMWLRKIKETFDPNAVCEPKCYISVPE